MYLEELWTRGKTWQSCVMVRLLAVHLGHLHERHALTAARRHHVVQRLRAGHDWMTRLDRQSKRQSQSQCQHLHRTQVRGVVRLAVVLELGRPSIATASISCVQANHWCAATHLSRCCCCCWCCGYGVGGCPVQPAPRLRCRCRCYCLSHPLHEMMQRHPDSLLRGLECRLQLLRLPPPPPPPPRRFLLQLMPALVLLLLTHLRVLAVWNPSLMEPLVVLLLSRLQPRRHSHPQELPSPCAGYAQGLWGHAHERRVWQAIEKGQFEQQTQWTQRLLPVVSSLGLSNERPSTHDTAQCTGTIRGRQYHAKELHQTHATLLTTMIG